MSPASPPGPVRVFLDELCRLLRAGSLPEQEIERAVIEAEQHIRDSIDESLGNGAAPAEAVAEALRRFGTAEQHAGDLLDLVRRRGWLRGRSAFIRGWTEDLRLAVRLLSRRPTFALASVITLALGIGAATAVFSLANHLLLRPLPGVDSGASLADAIFAEWHEDMLRVGPFPLSYPDIAELGRHLEHVSVAGYSRGSVNVAFEGNPPRRLIAESVTASFFDVLGLGVRPGRAFSAAEDDPAAGAARVAVISRRMWRSVFDDNPDAIGRSLWVNGVRLTIVGVAPPRFVGLHRIDETDLWLPGALTPVLNHSRDPSGYASRDRGIFFEFVARLAPGSTWASAKAELDAAAAVLPALHDDPPDRLRVARFEVYPGLGVPPLARPVLSRKLRLLAIVVALVLLIACSNVAGLLLLSGLHRRSELALRKALGAGAWRLARQHLTEGIVLWLLGGAAGLAAAAAMVRLFEGTMSAWSGAIIRHVDIDYRVPVFAALLSLGVGVLFAAIPAFSIGRASPSRWLDEGQRTTRGRWRHARSGFTIVQLAASLMLLLGASLFVRTLRSMNGADLGFAPRGVTRVAVSATDQGYDPERLSVYYGELVEALRARPEIDDVALGVRAPLGCCGFRTEVRPAAAAEDAAVLVGTNFVSGDFFRALGIPVLQGRVFAAATSLLPPDQSPDEIVVTRSLARRLFDNGEAVGRDVVIYEPDRPYRVVGVVADARYDSLTDDPVPMLYYSSGVMLGRLQLFLRARDAGAELGTIVRAAAAKIDPLLPPAEITKLEDVVDRARADTRLFARLLGGLSLVALAISAVGLYGLVSFGVAARNREFGVRMALGAAPSSICTMVLRGAVLLALAGVALGAAAGWAGRRLVESRLAGVSSLDPLSWAVAAVSLVVVAILAALIPAHRATRVDPVQTLRDA